jgi:hypothetical protein
MFPYESVDLLNTVLSAAALARDLLLYVALSIAYYMQAATRSRMMSNSCVLASLTA